MRPIRPDGRPLDAEFFVEPFEGRLSFVIESRGGPKVGLKSRNPDYAPALELCLRRMKGIGLIVDDAFVDSTYTEKHAVPRADCRLLMEDFPLPLELEAVESVRELRLALTSAQGGAGLPGGRQPNKSGAFKRARLVFRSAHLDWTARSLEHLLAVGPPDEEWLDHGPEVEAAPVVDPTNPEPPAWDQLDRRCQAISRAEQSFLRGQLFGSRDHATCGICGRDFPVQLLITAHIKPRALCNHEERLDGQNIVMPACLLGCDALYERGLCAVDARGIVQVHVPDHAGDALTRYLETLSGKPSAAWTSGSAAYFAWHYRTRFRGVTASSW